MKRCFLALALLGMVAGLAHAEFVIIRVNLGVAPAPVKKDPMNPMGFVPIPPGGIGKGPMGPGKGPMPVAKAEDSIIPLTLVAIVEYEKAGIYPATNRYYFGHKWSGRAQGGIMPTYLWADDRVVQFKFMKHQSLAQAAKARREDFNKKKDRTPQDYLDRADWALTHGLLDEKDVGFKYYMEELAKTDVKDAAAAEALKAYKQVRDGLDKKPERDDAAVAWKQRYELKSYASDHYLMLYDMPTNTAPPDVTSRVDRLEKNYQMFFYWFALRGKSLPLPKQRLVAFLVDSPIDFWKYHEACDKAPMAADGFFVRRDNIIVLSTERLDEQAVTFNAHMKGLIQAGWNPKNLLKGIRPRDKMQMNIDEVDYAQTMVLVQKVLQEEAEVAAVSHEGTRQLLAATGFLPRTVALPDWVQYGLPSVWDTCKYDPVLGTGAFWHGFGLPSWTHLVHYKVMEANKDLPPPDQALLAVLNDLDFLRARFMRQPEYIMKARTMAWALCYFLAQRHLDGLQRYGQELSALPRDLELDGDVTIAAFTRAFKLTDASGQVDQAKFRNFANEWAKYMEIVQPPMDQKVWRMLVLDEAQKAYKEFKEKQAGMKPAGAP
jgi:hypothetical protein